ncbi:CHAP domain-containing protein [Patescibacteria group bacterium]|nr:CHAP domain-containing protein [Patescibacteria group bacterium]
MFKNVLRGTNFLGLFVYITFLLFISVNVDAGELFGSYLGEFNGVAVYSNGYAEYYSGQANYVNGIYTGIKWQCVEYVRRYYLLVYGLDLASKYLGDANTWYNNATIMGLDRYSNGNSIAPQVGDILVSDGGPYGHIAIIRKVSDDQVCTVQQNFSNNTNDINRCFSLVISNGKYTVGNFSSNYPIKGWLRYQSGSSIVPNIKANGSDGPIDISQADTLSVTVELNPGSYEGTDADWWLAFSSPYGSFYFSCGSEDCEWKKGLSTTIQGPLTAINPVEVLNISGLPTGTYTFYFGVDLNMNGNPDEPLYYDSVVVNIEAPRSQIAIGPSVLNFGQVEIGSCSSANFSIQHVLGTDLATGTVSVSPNPPFSIISGSTFSVSNGSATNVLVQFCPITIGTFNGIVSVTSNATFTGNNTVTLLGNGIPVEQNKGVNIDWSKLVQVYQPYGPKCDLWIQLTNTTNTSKSVMIGHNAFDSSGKEIGLGFCGGSIMPKETEIYKCWILSSDKIYGLILIEYCSSINHFEIDLYVFDW